MSDQEIMIAFDWIFFGDGLFPEDEQQKTIKKLIDFYPNLYQQWLKENESYLTKE